MTTLIKRNRNNKRNLPLYMDDFFSGSLLESFFNDDFFNNGLNRTTNLKTNYDETDSEYIMEMALPGMDKSDVNIELDGDYLNVSSKSETKENNHWAYQSFNKRMYVGDNVDKENITSKMENGILKINMPKTEEQKITKRIIEVS